MQIFLYSQDHLDLKFMDPLTLANISSERGARATLDIPKNIDTEIGKSRTTLRVSPSTIPSVGKRN